MFIFRRLLFGVILTLCTAFSTGPVNIQVYAETGISVSTIPESYPIAEFTLSCCNTGLNLCIVPNSDSLGASNSPSSSIQSEKSGDFRGSKLVLQTPSNTSCERWRLNYIDKGIYEIINVKTGEAITRQDGTCVLKMKSNSPNQRWGIVGVHRDFEGNYLYYKIVDVNNSGQALSTPELSANTADKSISICEYKGTANQLFKLNCVGLDGFAGNSLISGAEKAGTIGGLLGETVYVRTGEELKSALNRSEPLTIVVTGDINYSSEWQHQRIRSDKTLVGSFGANKIIDCAIRTNDFDGAPDDSPSNNIIFRNIHFVAQQVAGRILVQIWSSRNIWIDHCTFDSSLERQKNEVGKFLWVNSPYSHYADAKDRLRSPDYITVSYCVFRNRYWTVAYGTQNDETNRCRTTLCFNQWDRCVRRCPQIGNGWAHVYCNDYLGDDREKEEGVAQIIGGDGSTILSENCRFQSVEGKEIIVAREIDSARDEGSYTSKTAQSEPHELVFNRKNVTPWHPSTSNYGYYLTEAFNNSGTDTKAFCKLYSGCFDSPEKFRYISDPDMQNFVFRSYSGPRLSFSPQIQ